MGVVLEVGESTTPEFIEEGERFLAKVKEVKQKEIIPRDKTKDPFKKMVWKCEIIDTDGETAGPHNERILYGECGIKFEQDPACKLHSWTEAALGEPCPVGKRIDFDDCLEETVIVVVGVETWDTKDGEASKNTVKDIEPTKAKRQALREAYEALEEPF